ncbi:MAG: PAS domain S-box protein [Alphaproteobacteria bacterium]|nr:PAS domain S-box protein [Alphaproteobacteria bacterium]
MSASIQYALSDGIGAKGGAGGDRASPEDKAKMRIQRRALMLRGAPVDIAVGAVSAVGVSVAGLGHVDTPVLVGWGAMAIAVGLARLYVWHSAAGRRRGGAALMRFNGRNIGLLAAKGALWGAIAPAFLSAGPWLQAVFPLVVALLSASSVATAGPSWRSVLAFNAPLLLSTAAAYAFLVEGVGYAAAGATIAYGIALAFVANNLERTIVRSIRIRTRDETNFRLLEKRLDAANESEARFRSLVEASRELTIIFSPDGRITYVSPAIGDLLGESAAAYIGKTTKDLVQSDNLGVLKEAGAKSLARMGEATPIRSICFVGSDGACRTFAGKLVNMLYVQGVEGFVFVGGLKTDEACSSHPTAISAERRRG